MSSALTRDEGGMYVSHAEKRGIDRFKLLHAAHVVERDTSKQNMIDEAGEP